MGVHEIIGSITGNYYRPQTKFAKVMFLHVSVCPRRGGLLLGEGVCCQGVPGPGRCLVKGGGVPGPGGVWMSPVTATAAGGTHPSGM